MFTGQDGRGESKVATMMIEEGKDGSQSTASEGIFPMRPLVTLWYQTKGL